MRLRNHHYTSFSYARNCAYLIAEGRPCAEGKQALDFWRSSMLESDLVNQWKLSPGLGPNPHTLRERSLDQA